jgi:hypothetical protein
MANSTASRASDRSDSQPSSVASRQIESRPTRVIQVERVRVTDEPRTSVASAIREGRESTHSSSR